MCQYPLFETILIIEGKVQNIRYHQKRYEHAMREYFHSTQFINLEEVIRVPIQYCTGTVRCKIRYHSHGYDIEFFPYIKKAIQHFRCVHLNEADYSFKYTNRQLFDQFSKKTGEEIIIIKNGFVSDCTIGNLLLLKNGIWHSPAHYLLKGTQLSRLLGEKRVILTVIKQSHLFNYEQVMMINALNPFDLERAIPINEQTIHC